MYDSEQRVCEFPKIVVLASLQWQKTIATANPTPTPYTILVTSLYNIRCTLILYSLRPKRFIGSIILTETPCPGHPPPSNACSLATNASKACCPSVSTDSTCSKYHSELSAQVSTQAFFLSIKRSFTSGRHEKTTAIPMSDSKKHQSIFIIFVSC